MPKRVENTCAPAKSCVRDFASVLRRNIYVAALLAASLSTANAEEARDFAIDAGPAAQTLNQFAQQAGVELGFATDSVGGVRTNAVSGHHKTEQALYLLLEGTGLLAAKDETGFIVSRDSMPGIADQTSAPAADTREPANYQNRYGSHKAERDNATGQSKALEEIVVTGSHLRGVGNAGILAISFSREEIARTGFSTVEELFESLPQNLDEITPIGAVATGATNLAAFNTQGATAINLRGLGASSTLVLLNGKRRPGNINGRAVDISAIPLAMVERVDVVTGGYSAVYGSDAVAGVVNVITRSAFNGAETQVYYGESSAGGGRLNLNQAIGLEFEKGGFVLGYDYRDDRPLDAAATGLLRVPSPAGLSPIPGIFHIQGAATQHAGLLTGSLELAPNAELYADAQLASADYHNQLAYQILGCCDLDVHIVTDNEQYSAVAGARFSAGDRWAVDVSTLYGSVRNTTESGSLLTSEPGAVDRFDPRPQPTTRDDDEALLKSISAVADGSLPLLGRSISAAFGIDYRNESYLLTAAPIDTGVVEDVQERDRDVASLFGEVHLPIIEGATQSLGLSLAARYDDYSDFGSTFNPQVGMEWRPTSTLTLRGSFATAFRAPELFELSRDTRVRIATLVDPADPSGQTSATVFIDAGGNDRLQPEEADTYTLAASWAPADTVQVSLSYFDVQYEGRIDTPDSFSGGFAALENESFYPALIDRNPDPARIDAILSRAALVINNSGVPFDPSTDDPLSTFENIIIFDNRTNNIALASANGFDLQATTHWETAAGRWSVGLNGTYYLAFDRSITASAPAVSQLDKPGRPIDMKVRGHLEWERGPWTTSLFVNYADSYRDTLAEPALPVDSWTTVDLVVRFDADAISDMAMLRGLVATLGINNALDEPPPVLTSNDLGLGYDAINANPLGRFLSLRLAKRW